MPSTIRGSGNRTGILAWGSSSIRAQLPGGIPAGTYWLAIYNRAGELEVAGPRALEVRGETISPAPGRDTIGVTVGPGQGTQIQQSITGTTGLPPDVTGNPAMEHMRGREWYEKRYQQARERLSRGDVVITDGKLEWYVGESNY